VHKGPLAPNHCNWKGSKYNVKIEWENGEVTSEPLAIITKDDPSPVPFMPRIMTYLGSMAGNISRVLPSTRRNYCTWLIK